MNSSKTITVITVTVLIMFLVIPMQSIPTRHKRWTFNTWRLHGRRSAAHTPSNPSIESYSPTISAEGNHRDQLFNVDHIDDDDSYKMLLHLLQIFQNLDHEQKAYGNNNQF